MAKASGDMETVGEAQSKITQLTNKYKDKLLNKIEKKFLWDWMDDVGRYQLPDLADFDIIWGKAQSIGIDNYSNYKE